MVNLVGGAPVQPLLNEVYRKAADDVYFRQCRQIVCMLGVGGGGGGGARRYLANYTPPYVLIVIGRV